MKLSCIDSTSVAQGVDNWRSATALGGKLYGIPWHAERLLVYDPSTFMVWGVDTTAVATGGWKWLAASWGGKAYGIPFSAESLLVYDPATGNVSGVDTSSVCQGDSKWGAAVAWGGKIFG